MADSTQQNDQPASSSSEGGKADLFTRHSDSVLCCSIDNRTRLAVSGGIDDTAFVWDLNTRHVIFECLGHKESVVSAAFSLNSTYVATGDLNGFIQVRNTTTGMKVFEYEIDEINWILWHNNSEFVLLAGTTKGDFWMWNVNDPVAVKTFITYGSSCTAARLLPDGLNIVVTYQDGSIRVFDLKTRQAVFKLTDPGTAEIISIDINPKKSILAVGSIDSSIRLITIGIYRQIGTLYCKTPKKLASQSSAVDDGSSEPMDRSGDQIEAGAGSDESETDDVGHIDEKLEVIDEYTTREDQTDVKIEEDDDDDDFCDDYADEDDTNDWDSVESVLFSPCGNYLAASNNSGTIIIWDVSTQAIRCENHTQIGITRCAWTDNGQYITGCLDGIVRIYDINLNEVKQISAHKDQILDVVLKGGVLVTASEDKTCRVTRL